MRTLIRNAQIVNEGSIREGSIIIEDDLIQKIYSHQESIPNLNFDKVIDAEGLHLFPGMIDDQVHFREPGLTHKADIYTESRAAVAGGITSFMEMPNTVPNTVTQTLLAEKYLIGQSSSLANYSFFMGATNNNIEEVLKTNAADVCGIKIFMGSSTGNMLVDEQKTLEEIFSKCPMLIATHCEDEPIVKANIERFKALYGEDIRIEQHPMIRSREACYKSSSMAVDLAKKHGTRLHILHISSKEELALFSNNTPLLDKKITAEACVHHLWFNADDYEEFGTKIKWNPAVKDESDRLAIFGAVLNNTIDIIATDHAPHTKEEKDNKYFTSPSGGPLVQHALLALFEFYHDGEITLEKIAEKTAHAPAQCFNISNRGFIREGAFADLVLVDLNRAWTVDASNVLSKCGWSPFEGYQFKSKIVHTWVSGHHAYEHGNFDNSKLGKRLLFNN